MIVPLLSEYDPIQLSEGSLDPLGLYSIADKLAVKLVPGVRERQLHPLFLAAPPAEFEKAYYDEVEALSEVAELK